MAEVAYIWQDNSLLRLEAKLGDQITKLDRKVDKLDHKVDRKIDRLERTLYLLAGLITGLHFVPK